MSHDKSPGGVHDHVSRPARRRTSPPPSPATPPAGAPPSGRSNAVWARRKKIAALVVGAIALVLGNLVWWT